MLSWKIVQNTRPKKATMATMITVWLLPPAVLLSVTAFAPIVPPVALELCDMLALAPISYPAPAINYLLRDFFAQIARAKRTTTPPMLQYSHA